MTPITNLAVAGIFEACPEPIRGKLSKLRQLIFDTASEIDEVGELEETLKWGEPAYVTAQSGSGSTVRINRKKSSDTEYAMYFHCRTNLVSTFRTLFPGELRFEGNRAIVFGQHEEIPIEVLRFCIAAALTYHLKQPSYSHGLKPTAPE